MIDKLRAIFLGSPRLNYESVMDDIKRIQEDAAANKLDISARCLRMEAKLDLYHAQTTERLDNHEKRLLDVEKEVRDTQQRRRTLSKTSEHFYDVLMELKEHDARYFRKARLGKNH